MNVCATCDQDFATLSAFDEHRTGIHDYTYSEGARFDPPVEDGRRCFAVAELEGFGWYRDKKGRWKYPRDWEMQAWEWETAIPDASIGEEAA